MVDAKIIDFVSKLKEYDPDSPSVGVSAIEVQGSY